MIIKLNDIKLSESDRVSILKIWDGTKIITRNLDNILSDFDYINQNFEFDIEDESKVFNLIQSKINLINSYIAGIFSTLSPESQFNSNHVTESGKTVKEQEEEIKKKAFEDSLKL